MKTPDQDFPALTQQAVYEAVAYNPESISRASLANLFGLKSQTSEQLDTYLNTLVREKKLLRSGTDATRFEAVEPISDMVVATIVDKPARGRAMLRVENVNFDLPLTVSISEKQVRRHRLRQGEKILAVLERHKGYELRAKYLDSFKANRATSLVGKFNESAAAKSGFSPLDKRIRTRFTAVGTVPDITDPRTPYYGQIASTFDPHHPEIMLGEQKWDPQTGNRIYEVIASNHGIRPRHDRPTATEAKKMSREARRMTPAKFAAQGRRDLTHLPIMVVDPKDARDHDDGIYVERVPGGFRTVVVVADVPLYVRPQSLLDEAARSRGFSHYFPDETFHMLPLQLSTHICSLVGGALRPVIYVEQMRDVDGSPYKTDIGLGYINSQIQMNYAQFQQYMAGDDSGAAAYRELQSLLAIKQYDEQISMESASTDHRYSEAQLIVQAMMIDANKAVAHFLEDRRVAYLHRTHAGHVNPLAYEEIAEEFRAIGYDLPDSVYDLKPSFMNHMINQAAARGEKERIQSMILLRLLEPARYSTQALSHWALNADLYTHFTSPIRRYGDIIVQRAVHTALGDTEYGLSEIDELVLERTARNLNHLQVINRNVQHDRMRYYAVKDLHRHEGNSMHAILTMTGNENVEVFLPAYGLKKLIPTRALPGGWRCTPNEMGITDGERCIVKGGRIRVTIADVQPHRAQWGISRLDPVKGHHFIENERKRGFAMTSRAAAAPSVA